MADFESNNVYRTPSADLYDSKNLNQLYEKIKADKKKLKRNNIVSTIVFIAFGVGLFYSCIIISGLIVGAGKVYEVPTEDVLEAIEPYKNLRVSIITFVIIGLVAYINFIIGNVKTGIYIILFSIFLQILLFLFLNTNLSIQDLYSIILLAPLILVALNSIRINYFRTKTINNSDISKIL